MPLLFLLAPFRALGRVVPWASAPLLRRVHGVLEFLVANFPDEWFLGHVNLLEHLLQTLYLIDAHCQELGVFQLNLVDRRWSVLNYLQLAMGLIHQWISRRPCILGLLGLRGHK